MNTWKVILATLVIFGAGVVTGGLFNRQCTKLIDEVAQTTHAAPTDTGVSTNHVVPPPAQIPGMRKDFVKRMDAELHLSPEQREKIDKIMADGQEHIKELWNQIAQPCAAQWHETLEKIRAELTEEQKVQFEAFMKNPRKRQPKTNAPPKEVSAPVISTNAPAVKP